MRTNRSCWSVVVCDKLDETCGVGSLRVPIKVKAIHHYIEKIEYKEASMVTQSSFSFCHPLQLCLLLSNILTIGPPNVIHGDHNLLLYMLGISFYHAAYPDMA